MNEEKQLERHLRRIEHMQRMVDRFEERKQQSVDAIDALVVAKPELAGVKVSLETAMAERAAVRVKPGKVEKPV